ncbi:MAG: hypothetical protein ABWK05_06835 [Pyrobaculum sp.]
MFGVVAVCNVCGAEFSPGGECPRGHGRQYRLELRVGDCEVRDFERFSLMPHTVQDLVMAVVEGGRGPPYLYPLFLILKDAGVLTCS